MPPKLQEILDSSILVSMLDRQDSKLLSNLYYNEKMINYLYISNIGEAFPLKLNYVGYEKTNIIVGMIETYY